jgi:hypothetical protein
MNPRPVKDLVLVGIVSKFNNFTENNITILHFVSLVLAMIFFVPICEREPRFFEVPRHIGRDVMSTHASVLVDSVGPPSAEVCRTAASFP